MSKKMIIVCMVVGALTVMPVLADEVSEHEATRTNRTDADIQRTEAPAQAQPATGEQMTPVLEPGLAAIETNFGQQMKNLKVSLSTAATEDQQEAIQQQMQSLKVEWTLALANRQLELAREKHDAAAEAEVLQAIAKITNPAAHDLTPIARDPEAGIQAEGGAK